MIANFQFSFKSEREYEEIRANRWLISKVYLALCTFKTQLTRMGSVLWAHAQDCWGHRKHFSKGLISVVTCICWNAVQKAWFLHSYPGRGMHQIKSCTGIRSVANIYWVPFDHVTVICRWEASAFEPAIRINNWLVYWASVGQSKIVCEVTIRCVMRCRDCRS